MIIKSKTVKEILSELNDPDTNTFKIRNVIKKYKYKLYMFPSIEILKLLQNDTRIKEEYWWINHREQPLPRERSYDEVVPWSRKAIYYLLDNDIIYNNMEETEINDVFNTALRAGYEDVVKYMLDNDITLKEYLVRNYIHNVLFSRNVELINNMFGLISSYDDFHYYLNLELSRLDDLVIEYMVKQTRGNKRLSKLRVILKSMLINNR